MADPRLEQMPDYTSDKFEDVCAGLQLGYNEDNHKVILCLATIWQMNRDCQVAAWNAREEDKARAATEVE